jgi:hypothetical protein
MEYYLLWTAFGLFFALVLLAFIVRGAKRRVLREPQVHPYLKPRGDDEPEVPGQP